MSVETAKEILKKIQDKTATAQEKKLAQQAYNAVHTNMLSKLRAPNV